MKATRVLKTSTCLLEAGLPCDLLLLDPMACDDRPGWKGTFSAYIGPLTSIRHLQGYLERHADLFIKSDQISIQVAHAVVESKTSCSEQGVVAQDYTYLYTMEYRDYYHHFLRDEITGNVMSLVMPVQAQGDASFLCVEGEKVQALICEGNRPGEKTKACTGLSLEALLPYIEHHIPLSFSTESFLIVDVLGEGFESVVLKVQNQSSGAVAALKLGKLDLEGNYCMLQPLLTAIKQSGISVPQYVSYDPQLNGILMEYSEGERFAISIGKMEQQKKTRFELFQVYAMCLSKLIALQSTFHLSHGDAHEENWLVEGNTPMPIDFRHSLTIPFTSHIYQYRDVFAMLCTLYRLVYGKHPANRREVKQAIMQQHPYQTEPSDAFPPFHHGNQYDLQLHQFLRRSLYNPQAFTLQDIAHIVEIYKSGFLSYGEHDVHPSIHHIPVLSKSNLSSTL